MDVCPSCGYRPEGEGVLVAWLLSRHNLSERDIELAARRVRAGQSIRPSERMLDRARRALRQHLTTDPGMSTGERVALLTCSLLLTPLVGWTLWAWWRTERPRAAIQALGLSLPATAIFTALVTWSWVS